MVIRTKIQPSLVNPLQNITNNIKKGMKIFSQHRIMRHLWYRTSSWMTIKNNGTITLGLNGHIEENLDYIPSVMIYYIDM